MWRLDADCPLANRYADRLTDLAKVYEPRGVTSWRRPNQQDSPAQPLTWPKFIASSFVPRIPATSPTLWGQTYARRLVLDAAAMRYRGRSMTSMASATCPLHERDLVALTLPAGKEVGRLLRSAAASSVEPREPRGDITGSNPVVQNRCVAATAGGIGPSP